MPRSLLQEVLGFTLTDVTLGEGAYSRVVLGVDKHSGSYVAIKIVDLKKNRAPFDLEVEAFARMQPHKNIVLLLGHHEDRKNRIGYLIEEFVDATTLDDYVDQKTQRMGLIEVDAVHIFLQLLSAVDHCHLANISHHDIKPENILYDTKKDRVCLIDFGLMQTWNDDNDCEVHKSSGSPLYMAPEVLRNSGTHNAIKSDIWSLGITFYYLLAGATPFVGVETLQQLVDYINNKKIFFPRYISQPLRSLLAQMLETEPDERPTIPNIMRQLKAFCKTDSNLELEASGPHQEVSGSRQESSFLISV